MRGLFISAPDFYILPLVCEHCGMAIATPFTRRIMYANYVQSIVSQPTWAGLHTFDPRLGPSEPWTDADAVCVVPDYTRHPIRWDVRYSGDRGYEPLTAVPMQFKAPPGSYRYVGIWDREFGGKLLETVRISDTTLGGGGLILVTIRLEMPYDTERELV